MRSRSESPPCREPLADEARIVREVASAVGLAEGEAGGGLAPLLREIALFARAAPAPRFELDQCHCTPETKLRRVLALYEADALVGRRILLLGDDDLVAVAIDGVVPHVRSPATVARLAVLAVAPAVIDFARTALSEAPLPVACVRHDLRDPL